MKIKLKIFLVCMLAFSLIFGSTIVLARDGRANIDVMYRNIKLMVNGVDVPATGDNEPFIYAGRTYVPLRLVSEALGYDVDWDGATSTVIIGEAPGGVSLSELKPYYHTPFANYREKITYDLDANMTMERQRYYNGFQVAKNIETERNVAPMELSFNLDGKYEKLTGLIGYDDSSQKLEEYMNITIYGDNRVLSRFELRADQPKPQEIDIDVSSVLVLKFELRESLGPRWAYAELINFADMYVE